MRLTNFSRFFEFGKKIRRHFATDSKLPNLDKNFHFRTIEKLKIEKTEKLKN